MGADPFSQAVRGMAARRVLLALSRFGGHVRRVTVHLAEPTKPLGGVDQRCQMRAWLQASDDIHAEAINGGIEAAVARTAVGLGSRGPAAAPDDGAEGATAPAVGAGPPSGTVRPNRRSHHGDAQNENEQEEEAVVKAGGSAVSEPTHARGA